MGEKKKFQLWSVVDAINYSICCDLDRFVGWHVNNSKLRSATPVILDINNSKKLHLISQSKWQVIFFACDNLQVELAVSRKMESQNENSTVFPLTRLILILN